MRMKNAADGPIRISQLDLDVPAGAEVDIEDGYCQYRTTANGTVIESTIEMLAPQLVPADPALVDAFRAHTLDVVKPLEQPPGLRYVDVAGLPPGVQQLVAEGNAAAVPPKQPKAQPTLKQAAAAQAEATKKAPSQG